MTSSGEWAIACVSQTFNVPADKIFNAWTDPDLVWQWGAGAVGEAANGKMSRVEIDARAGGSFIFADIRDGEEAVHHGEYLEIDRPHRLVFTWMPEPGEHSVVKMDFQPTETGCTVSLIHEMDQQWAEYVERTEHGWSTMLRHIAMTLE